MTVMWASVWGLIGSLTMLLVFAMRVPGPPAVAGHCRHLRGVSGG